MEAHTHIMQYIYTVYGSTHTHDAIQYTYVYTEYGGTHTHDAIHIYTVNGGTHT